MSLSSDFCRGGAAEERDREELLLWAQPNENRAMVRIRHENDFMRCPLIVG
jgi:hypothetical protein